MSSFKPFRVAVCAILCLKLRFIRGVIASLFALAMSNAQAGIVTIGNHDFSNADLMFPYAMRYQQLYDASQFADAINITRISFFAFPMGAETEWNGVSTYRMTVSTTTTALGALNLRFADNVGADASVYDTETFSGAPAYGDLISFTGSFNYDPALGNLLVDIERIIDGPSAGVRIQAGFNLGEFDRAYSHSDTVLVESGGRNQDGYGARTRFDFGPVTTPVPEPETYVMLLAGLSLLGFVARRRKELAV